MRIWGRRYLNVLFLAQGGPEQGVLDEELQYYSVGREAHLELLYTRQRLGVISICIFHDRVPLIILYNFPKLVLTTPTNLMYSIVHEVNQLIASLMAVR